MSDEIFFDGRRYISAHDAASSSDLTRDYIARLCRDGRVAGRRVGKNWYVDHASLKDFLVTQEFAKSRRSESLMRERAEEYHGTSASQRVAGVAQIRAVSQARKVPTFSDIETSVLARTPVHASRIISGRADEIKNTLAAAVAGQSQGGGQAKLLFSAPGGFAHAALTGAHVPVYALSPITELLHKITALALALMLTFGTYAAVDPAYARFAANSVRENVQSALDSYHSATGGGFTELAAHTQSQVAAAAENPGAAVASVGSVFTESIPNLAKRLARTLHSQVTDLVYAIAFPLDLVGSRSIANRNEKGSVSVEVASYTPRAADKSQTANLAITKQAPSSTRNQTIIQNPVIERIVETTRLISQGGITEEILNKKLAELDSKLSSRLVSSSVAQTTNVTNVYAAAASVGRIEHLDELDLTNPTITGGSITNAGISGGSISGASVSATTLSSSGDTSLATTTVTGDLTVTGAVNFSGTPLTATNATFVNATTTNATSTNAFATNLVATNATSTNFFATNASTTNATSTNLFSVLSNFTTSIISTLTAAAATITDLVATTISGTSLTYTNATTTNATSTNAYVSSLNAVTASTTNLTFVNATGTNATTTNLFATNSVATNSTSTSSFNTNLVATNATSTNLFSTTASSTNLFSTNGTIGVLTSGSLALSSALPVTSGGTGWANIAASAIPYGNGTGALSTTTAGTAGYVLAYLGGIPTWTATTTYSSGLAYANGNVTNTGLLSLTQNGGGSAQTGAITFATSSATTFNGLTVSHTITNSGATFTFGTPSVTGTLNNAGLTNSTISGVALGSNLADLTAIDGTLTFSGAYNGAAARTVGLNLAQANSWSALQQFSAASSTQFSAYQKAYFGGTATSTFDSTGALTLVNALTYGGVTLSNAVTGTGNMALSAAPTFTGTITAAAANFSGDTTFANATTTNLYSTTASSTNLYSTNLNAGTVTLGNATTTNLFSTTASSTNLFAQAASVGTLSVLGNTTHTGTLTQTGLATFTSGFLSNASSTITSGLFSMNGGASTTAFTASNIWNTALTPGRVTYAGTGGLLTDNANLTFDGTTLTAANLTSSGNVSLGNATSTNLFSTTASSTNLFSTNGNIGVLSAGTLNLTTLSATNGTFSGTLGVTGQTTLGQASTTLFSSYGPAYFGATATSSFAQNGALTLVNALTYGGVTLSNAVTGTGNMVLSASPTFTGTIAAAALNTSGAITSTATTFNTLPYASSTALTVSGHCVTADTRLRRRRRRSDGSYEYDEPEIVDIEEGDEIQSLDEKTGEMVWSRVRKLMFMGVKQTYRITTEDGRTIRTTAEHPYLVKNAKGKWLKHRSAITARQGLAVPDAGWATVANLREGDEIAVASANDFGNAFGNLGKGLGRERSERTADESLVNRYNLADEHDSFAEQAGTLLFLAFDMVVAAFGCRIGLRSECNQNDILARTVECIGRNNKSGTLFERAEISKGERNDDDVSAFIPGHRSNPDRYSRTRTTAPQASEEQYPQLKGLSILAIARAIAADLQVLTSLLLAQFEPKLNLAYAGSIALPQVKNQWSAAREARGAVYGERSRTEKAMQWAKILTIESVAEEDVYDIEVEGTHNFIGNDIVAHNTYLGTVSASGLSTLGQASTTLFSSYGPAYFGGTATSTFDSTGALTLVNALTYGGVTLSNAVTGTGNMVLSASPTLTGTITAAAANFSGDTTFANATSTSLFSTTASSTNLFSAAGSLGTLSLGADLSVANGGTGASTLTGLLQGNGTSAFTAITDSSTAGQILRVTGASTYAWGALDLADSDAITGDLPFANLAQVSAGSVLANITGSTADATSVATSSLFTWTGTGDSVRATSPTLITPALGTPSSGTVTNLTGTASININGTVGATTPTTGAFTTIAASGGYTQSGTSANTFTGTPTFSNATYSALFTGGNVGIGNTSPSYKLDVAGFINTDQFSGFKQAGNTILYASSTNFSTVVGQGGTNLLTLAGALRNTAVGYSALTSSSLTAAADDNTAIGHFALKANTTGNINTAVGSSALELNTTGGFNTGLGYNTLGANTTGSNNVGIGYNALATATSTDNQIAIGYGALDSSATGVSNLAIGYNALTANTYGNYNLGIGESALAANTTGNDNVAVGYQGLMVNTTGTDNTSVGYIALKGNTTGQFNSAFGRQALNANTTGSGNLALGAFALATATSTSNQIAIGYNALNLSATGVSNLAVGYNALTANTYGNYNNAIGESSLAANTTGAQNTAMGYQSMLANTTGSFNIAYGTYSLTANTTGQENVALSRLALSANTTGSYNLAAGNSSLAANVSGSSNVALGQQALATATSTSNQIAIGRGALQLSATGVSNLAIGYNALTANTYGSRNLAIGEGALDTATSTTDNVAIGFNALTNINSAAATNNTAIGNYALYSNTGGLSNTAVGQQALESNTTGASNSALGTFALGANTTGFDNGAFGSASLNHNTTGAGNNAFGSGTLSSNTTGAYNSAFGRAALYTNTTGSYNVASGENALYVNTTGGNNVALGDYASGANRSASSTVAVGYSAGGGNGSNFSGAQGYTFLGYQTGQVIQAGADYNTGIGYQAGYSLTTGTKNIYLGAFTTGANANITTGSNNIIIGNDVQAPSATASDQLNIGNFIYGTGLSGTGSTISTALIGIGATAPGETLQIGQSGGGAGDRRAIKFGNDGQAAPSASNTTSAGDKLLIYYGGGYKDGIGLGAGAETWFQNTNTNSTDKAFSFYAGTANGVAPTEHLTILTNGSVGVGTTTPWGKLAIGLNNGETNTVAFNIASSTATATTSLFTVLNTGKVGVGIAAPTALLHVAGRAGKITGTITSSGTAVTGASTLFLTEVVAGDVLQVGNLTATVASVESNTGLTLSAGFSHDVIAAANASINPTSNLGIFAMAGGTSALKISSNQGLTLQGDNTTSVLDTTNLLANGTFATNDFTSWTAGSYWSAATGAAVHTASTTAAILNAASVRVVNSGSNYTVGDILTLPGGDGNATITVTAITDGYQGTGGYGHVSTFTLSNAGTGYTDAITGVATGGTGTGFTFAITRVTAGDTLVQTASPAMISGESYRLTFVVSGSTQGLLTISLGGTTVASGLKLDAGTQTFVFQATGNTALTITPTADYNGTLDTFTLTHFENTSSPLLTFNNAAGTAALEMRTQGTTNTFVGLAAGKRLVSGANNTGFGLNALSFNTTGASNSAFGSGALTKNTTGGTNTAFGLNALTANTTGTSNNAFGASALTANTTGNYNVALGASALAANTTGSSNFGLGLSALGGNTTGSANTAIGNGTLGANTTGNYNVALGSSVLGGNTTGYNNIGIGAWSLTANQNGTNNIAIGYNALYYTNGASENVGIGYSALGNNTSGASNTAIGSGASANNNAATGTVAIGYNAGSGGALFGNQGSVSIGQYAGRNFLTGSDYNTLIGYQAGYNVTTGQKNIYLGYSGTSGGITTGSDNILIGDDVRNGLTVTSSNQLNIGNLLFSKSVGTGATAATGNIGVGTSTPWGKLSVTGAGTGTGYTFLAANSSNVPVFNIQDNGNVGIGTTGPGYPLDVVGSSRIRSGTISSGTAGSSLFLSEGTTNVGEIQTFNFDGTYYGMKLRAWNGSALADIMSIKGNGNVGIGTTSPSGKLQVAVTGDCVDESSCNALRLGSAAAGLMQMYFGVNNTSLYSYIGSVQSGTAYKPLVLNPNGGNVGIGTTVPEARTQITGGGLCVGSDANCNTDNNTEGHVYAAGVDMEVYDVAENYPTRDADIVFADIVALDSELGVFVKKATSAGGRVLGVISERPALLLGGFNGAQFAEERQVAVGLSGRIPVKVSLEGGPITIGDDLSLSSTPGVAKKAADGEQSIGYALENWTALQQAGNVGPSTGSGQAPGTIQFFITHGTLAGLSVASLTEELSHQPASDSLAGQFLANLFSRITEWFADASNGIQEVFARTFRASDKLCINDTCVNEDQLKALLAGQTAGAAAAPAPTPEPTPAPQPTAEGSGGDTSGVPEESPPPPSEEVPAESPSETPPAETPVEETNGGAAEAAPPAEVPAEEPAPAPEAPAVEPAPSPEVAPEAPAAPPAGE